MLYNHQVNVFLNIVNVLLEFGYLNSAIINCYKLNFETGGCAARNIRIKSPFPLRQGLFVYIYRCFLTRFYQTKGRTGISRQESLPLHSCFVGIIEPKSVIRTENTQKSFCFVLFMP